ncbi:MAG: glycosyltransferase family 2 protein [Acidimicrobiales bacterium]
MNTESPSGSSSESSAAKPALTVAVVICAHTMDRLDDIGAAVRSVAAQSLTADEVILVIDHNEELLNAVAELDAKVVPNTQAKGLSGARNTGTELATSDVVAYLDDDATAEPGWLEALMAPFADDHVVAVGGRAIPAWDTAAPDWFPPEYNWVVGCSHRGLPEQLAEVRNVIGCNMAFRRRPVLALGGFEVGLGRTASRPLGCEETELCIRLRQADSTAKILLEPAARIHHRVPAQRTTWQYFFDRCRAEGNSKAYVVGLVGSDDGLSSERSYVTSVLPKAFFKAAARLPRRPVTSAKTMFALGSGVLTTAAGFVEMKVRARKASA